MNLKSKPWIEVICGNFFQQNRNLFKWSDGWRTSYTNWGNEGTAQEEACAQLNVESGKWDAINCDTTLPYMCKFSTGDLNVFERPDFDHNYKFSMI